MELIKKIIAKIFKRESHVHWRTLQKINNSQQEDWYYRLREYRLKSTSE